MLKFFIVPTSSVDFNTISIWPQGILAYHCLPLPPTSDPADWCNNAVALVDNNFNIQEQAETNPDQYWKLLITKLEGIIHVGATANL